MNKGLSLAFTTTILWAIYNVFARYSVGYDINPAIFVCIGFMSAAFILLLIAGQGKLGVETLRSPSTWWYSLFGLLEHIITLYFFIYVTSTEGSLMQRLNVIMAMFIAYIFFSRKPAKSDLFGGLVISSGVIAIIMNLDAEIKGMALLCLFGAVTTQTIKTFLAEVHPISNKADTIKDRCRVTAIVSFATSIAFLLVILVIAYIKGSLMLAGDVPVLVSSMPDLSEFLNAKTFLLALVFGVIIEAPSIYAYFYSVMLVKTEKFMAIAALVPIFTFIFEYTLDVLGVLDASSITNIDILAGAIITLGALYMVYMRHIHEHVPAIKAKRQRAVEAEKEAGNSDYDMLCSTLEFCNHVHKDAAKLLGITVNEVGAVYEAEGERKFQTTKGLDIGRNYHRNVASADPLTRLSKREVLMKALRGAVKQEEPCTIMFIDLDKFKPVNDTYGHEAGNEILQAVAEVLNVSTPKDAVVARVGGDEFVIMLRNPTKKAVTKLEASIKQRLSAPMQVPAAFEPVQIGASIGVAHFPENASTAKDLMEYADAKMYLDKGDGR